MKITTEASGHVIVEADGAIVRACTSASEGDQSPVHLLIFYPTQDPRDGSGRRIWPTSAEGVAAPLDRLPTQEEAITFLRTCLGHKRCHSCGTHAEADAVTCPACGEASFPGFSHAQAPAPVVDEPDEPEAGYQALGRVDDAPADPVARLWYGRALDMRVQRDQALVRLAETDEPLERAYAFVARLGAALRASDEAAIFGRIDELLAAERELARLTAPAAPAPDAPASPPAPAPVEGPADQATPASTSESDPPGPDAEDDADGLEEGDEPPPATTDTPAAGASSSPTSPRERGSRRRRR